MLDVLEKVNIGRQMKMGALIVASAITMFAAFAVEPANAQWGAPYSEVVSYQDYSMNLDWYDRGRKPGTTTIGYEITRYDGYSKTPAFTTYVWKPNMSYKDTYNIVPGKLYLYYLQNIYSDYSVDSLKDAPYGVANYVSNDIFAQFGSNWNFYYTYVTSTSGTNPPAQVGQYSAKLASYGDSSPLSRNIQQTIVNPEVYQQVYEDGYPQTTVSAWVYVSVPPGVQPNESINFALHDSTRGGNYYPISPVYTTSCPYNTWFLVSGTASTFNGAETWYNNHFTGGDIIQVYVVANANMNAETYFNSSIYVSDISILFNNGYFP